MGFIGKPGTCVTCKRKTTIVCKGQCQYCYMQVINNKDYIKKRKKEWEKNNKHVRIAYSKKNHLQLKLRRAERLIMERTGEFVPINALKKIMERDNFTCQYCGSTRDLSFDHKIPISKGGNNTEENLVIACMTCNSLKSDMSVKEFKEKYLIETEDVITTLQKI